MSVLGDVTGWGSFGLTGVDSGLLSSSSRDPLGFEVIWTAFGERVVPRLSTVSRGISSFAVSLAHAWCVETYLKDNPTLNLDVAGAVAPLMARCLECVHALSVARAPWDAAQRRNLPGIATASRRLSGEVMVGLGADLDLLVNQSGMGINGRYRKPLMGGGGAALMKDDDTLNTGGPLGLELKRSLERDFGALREHSHALLDQVCAADGHRVPFSEVSGEMRAASHGLRVAGRPENAALATLIARSFGLEPGASSLQRRLLDVIDAGEGSHRERFEALRAGVVGDEDERGRRVADVLELEEILWRVELVFDRLWARDLDRARFEPICARLEERRAGMANLIGRAEGSAKARLEALDEALALAGSWTGFVKHLANTYHAGIAKARSGGTPWVVVEDRGEGAIAKVIAGGHSPRPEREGWRRGYYIATLAEFGADLERLTAAQGGDDGE